MLGLSVCRLRRALMDAERYEIWRDLIPGAREALASAERFERDLTALRVAAGATDEEIATLRERILKLARQVPDPLPNVTRQVGRKWLNERKRGELDPVMRSRAQDVIDSPGDWVLGSALIWRHRRTGHRVTDQAVEAVRPDYTEYIGAQIMAALEADKEVAA